VNAPQLLASCKRVRPGVLRPATYPASGRQLPLLSGAHCASAVRNYSYLLLLQSVVWNIGLCSRASGGTLSVLLEQFSFRSLTAPQPPASFRQSSCGMKRTLRPLRIRACDISWAREPVRDGSVYPKNPIKMLECLPQKS
jgi:hypothetical protein